MPGELTSGVSWLLRDVGYLSACGSFEGALRGFLGLVPKFEAAWKLAGLPSCIGNGGRDPCGSDPSRAPVVFETGLW
jgi:hypothetical protein